MSWFFLAIIGHLANGIAFIIDKILLKSSFTRSATYAGLVGILSAVVILAIPFVHFWPQNNMWFVAIISGVSFVFALWTFFAALSRSEASRIVPIVGSLIPILTLIGAFTFLGERLSDRTFLGFFFLIVATFLLSSSGAGKPTKEAVWLAITSAFLFALSSVTAKSVYDTSGFFGGFVTTRIAAAATSFILLTAIDRKAGDEVLQMMHPPKSKDKKTKEKSAGSKAAVLALVGQTLGAVGFLCVQWATASGSASIVNAMQAVQYALLVVVGIIFAKRAPHLLDEKLTTHTLIIKGSALALTAIGMYLIV